MTAVGEPGALSLFLLTLVLRKHPAAMMAKAIMAIIRISTTTTPMIRPILLLGCSTLGGESDVVWSTTPLVVGGVAMDGCV